MPAKSLQTLVKQRYLNTIRSVQTASRWKVLVVDSVTMEQLSSVMRMFDILEQNVTKVENIEKRRDASPGVEAAYVLTATTQNVDRLITELAPNDGQPQYEAAHVFFLDAAADALVERLMQSKAAPRVRQLVELFLTLWPIEAQAFVVKQPNAFHTLFQPMNVPYAPSRDEALALVQDELDAATQSLLNLCITLNENPHIRYLSASDVPLGPLSEAAADGVDRANDGMNRAPAPDAVHVGESFTKQLALRVQVALDEYTKNGQLLGEPGRPQGVLFITDRSMDAAAPFLHEFTYQAMISDLLAVTDGTYRHSYINAEGQREETVVALNDEDDVWVTVRHMHIAEAIAYLTQQFQQHVGEAAQLSSSTSISGMRDMLASLPHLQSTKEKMSVHLSLAQQCMDRFEKSKLAAQAMVEQNSATGQTPEGSRPRSLVEEMVPLLDDASVTNADKVRIIALYIMFCDGVQDEDRRRLFQHARLSPGEETVVNNLVHLGVRITRDSSGPGLDAIFRRRRRRLQTRAAPSGSAEYELSRYQPLIRTMIEDHALGRLDQSLFPYVRDAPPESARPHAPRSLGSFGAASDVATSMLHSAIHATGGKDSPLARVGRFDASSGQSGASLRGGAASLRSARPTWHQRGRTNSSQSVAAGPPGSTRSSVSSASMSEPSNPTAQRVIVYMAGGMTHSEMRTAYQLGKRINADVYIGSSHVFTPLAFMESLRVMGTPRQPLPEGPHIEARRRAAADAAAAAKAKAAGSKAPPKVQPPVYPQYLPAQARYDLRYQTLPPPEPEKPPPPEPGKLSATFNALRQKTTGADAGEAAPQPASTQPPGAQPAAGAPPGQPPKSDPLGLRRARDMSKFKVGAPLPAMSHPSGAALTSAKERHYAYLASRITALSTTMQHTQHYLTIASEQAAYMKDLGIGQSALYVGSAAGC
ncbi:syntaxin binding protein 1 [Malassezia sp. CBS 17886]|nr:syntaxin binding protein 1 [Malassezia sp. CBS 17886]